MSIYIYRRIKRQFPRHRILPPWPLCLQVVPRQRSTPVPTFHRGVESTEGLLYNLSGCRAAWFNRSRRQRPSQPCLPFGPSSCEV